MTAPLTDYQQRFAHHVLMFDHPLSRDLDEAVHRSTLACAENKRTPTGVLEFFCGLFLQYKEELQAHFKGDITALVSGVFPTHRFGNEGLIPSEHLQHAALDDAESQAGMGVGYSVKLTDDLIRLLWTATRLANAVGKKTSLKDVAGAIALDDRCIALLGDHGITFRKELFDFRDVLNVVFFAPIHKRWAKTNRFSLDPQFKPPFRATVKTPSGGFQPMREGTAKVNQKQIAKISWPDKPVQTATVELQGDNTVEVDFDGPDFGSMEVIIRCHPLKEQ